MKYVKRARTINFKIYYHDDMDGMCSRVIAEKMIMEQYCEMMNTEVVSENLTLAKYGSTTDIIVNIEPYELNYGPSDIDVIDKITGDEEQVIILDYSFTTSTIGIFKEILKKTHGGYKLLWIDHHDSSIKFMKDHILPNGAGEHLSIDSNVVWTNFVISKSGSAAYLTWAVYKPESFIKYPPQSRFQYPEVCDMYKQSRYVPPVVRVVSDYDTFQHKIADTFEFKSGYDTYPDGCTIMRNLFNFFGGWDSEEIREYYPSKWATFNTFREVIAAGKVVKNYTTAENKKVIKVQGYRSCIKDPKTNQMEMVYVCNRFDNSLLFGELYDQYKYVVVYYFDGSEYKYSIFSNLKIFPDADCCNYAEQFGGGGHKGAAGWRSKELMFLKDTFVLHGVESHVHHNTRSNSCEAMYMDN